MDRCKLIAFIVLLTAPCIALAEQQTTTVQWDFDASAYAESNPCLIRVYVGPVFAGAAYDDKVVDSPSSTDIAYDLPPGRYSAVATAEVGRGPLWTANSIIAANGTVIPTTYSMALGDVYYTTLSGGTTGAAEPAWSNTDGATIVDGTVTWTVHNATPRPWTASTQYNAGDLVMMPVSAGLPGMVVFRCFIPGQSGMQEPDWKSVFPNKRPGMQWERRWEIPGNTTIYDGTALWTAAWRGECCSVSRQSNRIVLQGGTEFVEVGRRWN